MSTKLEYLILAIILIAGAFFYTIFGYNDHLQRNIIYATGGLYFLWSLHHHYRLGDLHLSIIIEYLVIILLGLVVLSSTFL